MEFGCGWEGDTALVEERDVLSSSLIRGRGSTFDRTKMKGEGAMRSKGSDGERHEGTKDCRL
jgi:hypothetical protein